jgi:hypothetical protein
MKADHNKESHSRDGQSLPRFGIVALAICIFGVLAFVVVFGLGVTRSLTALQYQFISPASSMNGGARIAIAYPSATNICVDGCQAHENWIRFYLVSNSYVRRSLRLRTSLFLAQILTVGIGSSQCSHQDKAGYTCINMEISHRLLWALTGLNLTPLDQVRDIKNWWLEYTQAG